MGRREAWKEIEDPGTGKVGGHLRVTNGTVNHPGPTLEGENIHAAIKWYL